MVARCRCWIILVVGIGLVVPALAAVRITGASTALPDTTVVAVPTSEEVLVPAGESPMGCASDIWSRCDSDSQPIHAVYLDAFYIDKTEVTVSQYYECVAAGVCPVPEDDGASLAALDTSMPDNNPITYMTWVHADTYCRWIGKRLPTEAEWEKAAHGADLRIYPWGNEAPTCDRLNFNRCVGGVVPVGSYPQNASPYGALDMAGNVREWVNDWYLKFYYARSPYYNPQGPERKDTVGEHLLRGGSWKDDYSAVTTRIRLDEAETYYIYKAGMRCARTAPAGAVPTPAPTPTPFAVQAIDEDGGAVWVSKPGHLTVLQAPAGSLTDTTTFTLTYMPAAASGSLSGIGHIFRVETDSDTSEPTSPVGVLRRPVGVTVVFPGRQHVISGTLTLYRLDHGTWVTDGITATEWGANYLNARVQYSGMYAMLGHTERIYLPTVLR